LNSNTNLTISFLPVGAGDCTLLQFNNASFNILIDAGPKRPQLNVERMGRILQDLIPGREIDLAIVTHHDEDHIGGFFHLLSEESGVTIKDMIFNSPFVVDRLLKYSELSDISARQGLELAKIKDTCNSMVVSAGRVHYLMSGQIELVFLSPREEDVVKYGGNTICEVLSPENISVPEPYRSYQSLQFEVDEFEEDNSRSNLLSLAFEVRFNGRAWLFLGDAWPSVVQEALEARYQSSTPEYELVKLSHHGSKSSTTKALVSKWSCFRYVILSDGRRHPDEHVLRRILDTTAEGYAEFYFPERTKYLDYRMKNYEALVNYPEGDGVLSFNY
jgi:beta-lactamase superfamily II metal-dependent hydrolase